MALSAGDKLGPYEILASIGTGGMGLAEKDQAFAWLNRAYAERSYYLTVYPTTDSRLDSIRSDPRFADLLRRVGLPE
jgi:hypothetical protein